MKKNHSFFDLNTYFIDKLDLNNLSIEDLQYQRKFKLNALYLSYLDELLNANVFGFQKNNCKNVIWKEYYFWKNFYFPTFDYTLVHARDIFTYKKGNVSFSAKESWKRNRREDKKEWKNKYLLNSWWNKNDDKLYIEENDKFSYLPDDVIQDKFLRVNYKDFVFTDSLPFGKINFLKTNNVLLPADILLFVNNEKICINLFFYYFFKGNSYLFENNVRHKIGSAGFTKHGFDASWMIIPTNFNNQANYIKMFYELEKQINLLIKIRKKSRNILHFLGKHCLDDKFYKLKDLVQKRNGNKVSDTEYFDLLKLPRADYSRHTVYPWRTVTSNYQWTKIKDILYSEPEKEINLNKHIYNTNLNDLIVPKIYSKTSNPFLVDRINCYAFSTDYRPLFSKIPEVSNQVIMWSIIGQNFYQRYANMTRRGTAMQRIDPDRFFNKKLQLIKPKYYHLTEHLSNVHNFCAKNISKYTELRKEIAKLLQDPAVIEDKTYEKHLLDLNLLNKKVDVTMNEKNSSKKWWLFWK